MPNVVRIPVAAGAFDPSDITITDDTSGALLIKEGSNEYMRINTTNGSELTNITAGSAQGIYISGNSRTNVLTGTTDANSDFRIINSGGVQIFRVQGNHDTRFRAQNFYITDKATDTPYLQTDTNTNFTYTLDDSSGAVFKIVDDNASPKTYLKAVEAGSISTERNFEIYNSTAPAASVTDGCILFCEDVSSSSELKVRDEAGNVTTLSPHNFSLIPEGASEEMAWSYYSEKDGKKINVDMLRLARLVEQISGEQIIFEEG